MAKALEQARVARKEILGKILEVIAVPNPQLKPHAPRITTVKIAIEKIGAIIGPGGKMIRAIQEETKTKIDIMDDGTIFIAATSGTDEANARERILALTETPELGRIYTGKVVRTTDFGAFIEILPGIDGMVHISQLDSERVERVEDVVQVGDEATVMVTGIDDSGKIRLSRQAVLDGWTLEEAMEKDRKGARPAGGGGGRPFNGNRGRDDRHGSGGGGGGDRNRGNRR